MDEKEKVRKKAGYALKAKLIDSISSAIEEGLSTEEIIGTIETIKQHASMAMIEVNKSKPSDKNPIGYR